MSATVPPSVVEARSDGERAAAARAILRERETTEAMGAWRALSPFEHSLAAQAYDAGAREVVKRVEQLIGPTATAIDPALLVAALRTRTPRLDFGPPLKPDDGWASPDREAAGQLVRAARSYAERAS